MSTHPDPAARRHVSIFGGAAEVKKYSYFLYIFFLRRRCNEQDIGDLAQEVWLRVVRGEYSDAEIRKPYAFLRTIARSVLIDSYRKFERSLPAVALAEAHLDIPSELLSARLEDDEIVRQQFKRLEAVWLELSQTHYEVWTLHKVQGLRQKEVASKLHLSEHTVKTYVTEATGRLREELLKDSQ